MPAYFRSHCLILVGEGGGEHAPLNIRMQKSYTQCHYHLGNLCSSVTEKRKSYQKRCLRLYILIIFHKCRYRTIGRFGGLPDHMAYLTKSPSKLACSRAVSTNESYNKLIYPSHISNRNLVKKMHYNW